MLSRYVNPFLGVDGQGNCLCGPYLPLSLVRLGPDTLAPQSTSGYRSNRPIIRFSHTHVSGTGGGGRYGNIGVTPFLGLAKLELDGYKLEKERAVPGYYSANLLPSPIKVELTTTPRVGIHRYTFPGNEDANILLDLGAVIQAHSDWLPENEMAYSIGGFVEWVTDTEVVGRADLQGGWGHRFPYSVYFYTKFAVPTKQRIVANHAGIAKMPMAVGPNCKAVASFGTVQEVVMHVGISYVSIAKARASVEREVGEKDFSMLRNEATTLWDKALARIQVEGGSDEQKTLFYTLFSRLLCMPSDLGIDDEQASWVSGVRHFTDFYCLWDSVRNANSLISLFDPELEVAFLNCLLDVAEHIGWLPDAWVAGHSAQIQGGSSADILFCEAALKGLKGIDYEKALLYMRKNNEVESPDPWLYGRHLHDYRNLGYVSTDVERSCVSRHLEYTYQDWCIAALAEQLHQHEIAQEYSTNSQKVWNLWREDIRFFAPRNPNGSWATPFDPTSVILQQWKDPYFYEGTSWQWSFNVQHDFAGLIARYGGNEGFIQHLDDFFERGYYSSKETMLHIPYLYIYAGRPDKTAKRVQDCMERYFKPTRDGLSDNEDMGCQSAWYMCSAIGLYPMMGQDLYLLTTPIFTRTEIALGKSGNILVTETPEAGQGKSYITAATLNGKPLERAWLRHTEIAHGATLHFELSTIPNAWGTQELPPSPLEHTGLS
ncbi:MAG: GH92 family glycosyl hydrolase [Ktedonobacteraceae bacterium]